MQIQAVGRNGLCITGTEDGQENPLTWTQTIVNMEQFQVGNHLFTSNHNVAAYLQGLD